MTPLKIYDTAEEALSILGFQIDDGAEGEEIMDTMRMHATTLGVKVPDNVLASISVASMDDQNPDGWRALIKAAADGKQIAFDSDGEFTIDGVQYDRSAGRTAA